MPNIYLLYLVTIKKTDILKTLFFSKFKKFIFRSVFGEHQLTQISLNFEASCFNLKIRGLGAKLILTFVLFWFWKELWHFKDKESMLFVEHKCNKNKTELKMENPFTLSERRKFCIISCKNRKLKLKIWWVGASERAYRALNRLKHNFSSINSKEVLIIGIEIIGYHFT